MDEPEEGIPEDVESDLQAAFKKVKPPNKKRFEEEIEILSNKIRTLEAELKLLQFGGQGPDLRSTRGEKTAVIEKLKKIDPELKSLNQEITKRRGALDRLQSTLTYKNESKIDDAIGKLDYQLKRQNFKLSEEKKIVAEIDSLKRSKKALSQYLTLKKEIDEMRDRQRKLREERDQYQRHVNKLRNDEDDIRKDKLDKRSKADSIKKDLEKLHEEKRKKIQDFKALEKEFQDMKQENAKIRRRDSVKKKQERRSTMESFQKDLEVYGATRVPYEDEMNLCNTLINYLQKFNTPLDESNEETTLKASGWSLIKAVITNELEDGKYVLLKKDDDDEYTGMYRKMSKSRRPSKKGRKQSVTKPVTHTPQIFSQFASLNLNAPSTISEIPASLEQLQARKKHYADGVQVRNLRVCTPTIEENSEGGISNSEISATESAMCEMSRQASNTESTENANDSPTYLILDELVRMSNQETETLSEKSENTVGRSSSDSTVQSCDDRSDHSTLSSHDNTDKLAESSTSSTLEESERQELPTNICNSSSTSRDINTKDEEVNHICKRISDLDISKVTPGGNNCCSNDACSNDSKLSSLDSVSSCTEAEVSAS